MLRPVVQDNPSFHKVQWFVPALVINRDCGAASYH